MNLKSLQFGKAMSAALFVLLLYTAGVTKANPVDITAVREVAIKFMNTNSKVPLRGAEDLQLVTTYNISRGDAAFYVFNTPSGFVIVSADDCATPILGYSEEGQFDVENIPVQLQDILQGYVEQIQYGIENHLEADEQTVQQWELVRTVGRLTNNRTDEVVEPLLSTEWDQFYPYNMYAPNGYPTGCVATAMAQIMKYWEWPIQGIGEHSYEWEDEILSANFGETAYDWDNMLDCYYGQSTQEQDEAVATLMWHCGVSVNMNYASGGSNAFLSTSSLIDYFNYSDDLHMENREYDESWMSLLKADLDLGRPVLYVGNDYTEAHAFVCDGYDVNDRFHFNYGWGGSSDGYYALNAFLYNEYNYAVFNIHPNASILRQVTASASPSDGGIVVGAGMYDIGSICTLTATANEGYTFMYWTEDDEVVSYHSEYSFCVRKDRDLVAHFVTPFPVEVVIVPEGGGVVSGAGEYDYGNTCTLTAIANEGYDFIGWRRANGTVVSTALTCSFTVTEATTLTAVFAVLGGEQITFADLNVKALCVANWDTDGDGELSCSEAAAVTDLGSVFRNQSTITSFEELQYFTGLTTIGNEAFYYCCNMLGSLYIPNSVTTIGERAFYGCNSFTGSLIIPNSVISIGNYAFYHCSGFTGSLTIPNSVVTIDKGAFYGCSGFTGSLTIGNSVATIGNWAFANCEGFMGSLTIPNSVNTIGNGAFEYCSGFTGTLNIPNSVTTIGYSAFYGCNGFTGSLVIGNSVTMIDYGAFNGCSGFTGSLTIPNSVTSIGPYAFYNCRSFTGNLVIPNSVTTIGDYAFWWCNGFTGSLTIPNSVTSIGPYAFYNCSGFTGNLVIPNSVTTIGDHAFWWCSGFTGSLTIPDSLATIDDYVFYNCRGFTGNLVIPNSVTKIGSYAFSGCSGFTGNLVIGNSVTSIAYDAFSGCSGFTGNLIIGNSVSLIGQNAFGDCSGFTGDLTIPNSVTKIDSYAFQNCSGFTGSLTIGNSITTIGYNAFYGCSGLGCVIMLSSSVPTLGSLAFSGSNANYIIYVPYSSLNAYKTAAIWSNYESRIQGWLQKSNSGFGNSNNNWALVASPLIGNTSPTAIDCMIADTTIGYDLYRFNQSAELEWENYKAFNLREVPFFLVNGQGYLYANNEDVNLVFKGLFNENESEVISLTYDSDAVSPGWNLVGNPFPCYAYINRDYYVMNEDGTTINPVAVSSSTPIPPCTGVIVKADSEGETVVFTRAAP